MKDHTRLLLEKADHAIRTAKILEEGNEIELAAAETGSGNPPARGD